MLFRNFSTTFSVYACIIIHVWFWNRLELKIPKMVFYTYKRGETPSNHKSTSNKEKHHHSGHFFIITQCNNKFRKPWSSSFFPFSNCSWLPGKDVEVFFSLVWSDALPSCIVNKSVISDISETDIIKQYQLQMCKMIEFLRISSYIQYGKDDFGRRRLELYMRTKHKRNRVKKDVSFRTCLLRAIH